MNHIVFTLCSSSDGYATTESMDEIRKEKNYLKRVKLINDLIKRIENDFKPISHQIMAYRARKGYDKKNSIYLDLFPFEGSQIGVAPVGASSSGRANREFWSFLYLAEDTETAMLEVRPNITDFVSVGQFKNTEEVKIFNLAEPNLFKYYGTYDSIWKLEEIACLNNLFRQPVNSDGSKIYLETQLFTEQIALLGYDGISFSSSLTGKINYTIFNFEKFQFVENSSKLYEVKKINLGYEQYISSLHY